MISVIFYFLENELTIGNQINVTITTADSLGYLVNIDNHNVEAFLPLSEAHRRLADARLNPIHVGSQHTAYIIRTGNMLGVPTFDVSLKRPGQRQRPRIELVLTEQNPH